MKPAECENSAALSRSRRWLVCGEWLAIFLLFLGYAGQLPPDVNESHYLPKALQYWQPRSYPDDLFLNSEPTHWLFYAATGWWTFWLSLDQYAWLGRGLAWSLLAASWLRLSGAVIPRFGFGLVTASLAMILIDRGHLAGEWMIGGWESKSIAYAIVVWAWAEWLRGRSGWLPAWLGTAAAWHLLVGIWAALTILWQPGIKARPIAWLCGALGLGIGLAAPLVGMWNTAPESLDSATDFQVRVRLAHHLYFPEFGVERQAAFSILLLLWLIFFWLSRQQPVLVRMNRIAAATIVCSWMGLLLSALAHADGWGASWALSLLRLYWFRLADIAVPVALALTCVSGLWQAWLLQGESVRRNWGVVWITCIVVAMGLVIAQRHQDARPRADQATLMSDPTDAVRTAEIHRNWLAVCQWIRENTPTDAMFMTPADQQTFKWYAQRSEFCNWKDMPQDANSLVEWRQRLEVAYWPQRQYTDGLLAYSDEQLSAFARQYKVRYAVVKQADLDRSDSRLPVVYPVDPARKTTYAVIQMLSDAPD